MCSSQQLALSKRLPLKGPKAPGELASSCAFSHNVGNLGRVLFDIQLYNASNSLELYIFLSSLNAVEAQPSHL